VTTRDFSELSEQEVLALAIALEAEDQRTYEDFAAGLRPNYAESALIFTLMAAEESDHRHRLLDLYQTKPLGDLAAEESRHEARAEESSDAGRGGRATDCCQPSRRRPCALVS
jgi:rubrerythrin